MTTKKARTAPLSKSAKKAHEKSQAVSSGSFHARPKAGAFGGESKGTAAKAATSRACRWGRHTWTRAESTTGSDLFVCKCGALYEVTNKEKPNKCEAGGRRHRWEGVLGAPGAWKCSACGDELAVSEAQEALGAFGRSSFRSGLESSTRAKRGVL